MVLRELIASFDNEHGLVCNGLADPITAVYQLCDVLNMPKTALNFQQNIQLFEERAFFDDSEQALQVLTTAKQEFEEYIFDLDRLGSLTAEVTTLLKEADEIVISSNGDLVVNKGGEYTPTGLKIERDPLNHLLLDSLAERQCKVDLQRLYEVFHKVEPNDDLAIQP